MKKLLMFALLLIPVRSMAALGVYPYLRPIDVTHPQPIAGALIDPRDVQNSAATVLMPLITHSPVDGCMLPTVVCEDWSPLAVGGSMIAGKVDFIVGPVFNVMPIAAAIGHAITPNSFPGVQKLFAPASDPTTVPVTFSGGPMWEYKSETNKGFFRVFTGVALHF